MPKNSTSLSLREATFARPIPMPTAWLLADCMEFRGKQALWVQRQPEMLAALREQAMIQSVESSNRIEGVVVEPQRLLKLVLGRVRPKDRPEEEVAGYRQALEWIFSRKRPVNISPRVILHLHSMAPGGMSGDAGAFKSRDHEIVEFKPGVGRVVRFKPTSARDTPAAVRQLCASHAALAGTPAIPALMLIATFVFDFLCIHPFRDGNGRVSRLITTLLLQQHGFSVGRFVSLERLIEQTKEEYYAVLARCSRGWHSGENEIAPWWNYFLTIVRRGYGEFAQNMDRPISGGKTELVRQTALAQVGAFTLADLMAQLPSVSPHLIKKVLGRLRREQKLINKGYGRGSHWEVRDES